MNPDPPVKDDEYDEDREYVSLLSKATNFLEYDYETFSD